MKGESVQSIGAKLLSEEFLNSAAPLTGLSRKKLIEILKIAIGEAQFGYTLIEEYDLDGKRILEVGSGAGILSACLRSEGRDITSIEPAIQGFEMYRDIAKQVHRFLNIDASGHLSIPIEELNAGDHGMFDFIFSINVLEHVADIHRCLSALSSLLTPGGMMVHTCPNYIVPYEPHYGIPLVPFFPGLTRYLLYRKLRDDECWKSLNFITYRDIQKSAKKNSCAIAFKRGVLYDSLMRLERDSEFRERQRTIPLTVFNLLRKTNSLNILKHIPYQISTPMVFEWKK